MKQEALFKKLGNILSELNEQYQFLSQNPEQLTELELELFLANASFLTDHIQIIKKLNLPLQVAAIPAVVNETINEPIVDEEISDELKDIQQVEAITFANLAEEEEIIDPVSIILPEEEAPETVFDFETPVVKEVEKEIFRLDSEPTQTFEFILNKDDFNEDDKFDFEEKTTEQLFDRPLSKEEELILEQKKKVKENLIRDPEELEEDEVGPEPFLVQHEEATEKIEVPKVIEPVAEDKVAPTVELNKIVVETTKYQPTLNDLLAGKNTSSRLNETSGAVVTDLKAAINLNDKLLYIKDLFNGYNLAYAEAIDIANKMPNFDAADNFFQKNYAVKNNWADKQATVDKFYLLLNKRFRD
ncbi:hypothetical protein [Pedobacter sp. SL55]|uniref:hypothetical protein n=1 Tax=Pedobacter sp. SL55 TaxID=2995161 RepID=UPI00227130D3|nr:hypothetical protein [Pedobacter sp. SL55]WAC41006.1 hypothetical protein OVA16_01075 [Pedobacter sp. SL55]